MSEPLTIPAGHGLAVRVAAVEAVAIINTHGTQVVDTWAFRADLSAAMSMPISRVENGAGDLVFEANPPRACSDCWARYEEATAETAALAHRDEEGPGGMAGVDPFCNLHLMDWRKHS